MQLLFKEACGLREEILPLMEAEQERLQGLGFETLAANSFAFGINLPGDSSDLDFAIGSTNIERDSGALEALGMPFRASKGISRIHTYPLVWSRGIIPVDLQVRPLKEVLWQTPGVERMSRLDIEERFSLFQEKMLAREISATAYKVAKWAIYERYRVIHKEGDWSHIG